MKHLNYLVLIVLLTIQCNSIRGDIDTSADTDFFDQNYVDGLKTTDDYLDPEADTSPSESILTRKSRSLLATPSRVRKGKGKDKGDTKFLITDYKKNCIYLYTEEIKGLLMKYQLVEDEALKRQVLKPQPPPINFTIIPDNVQNVETICPDLKKQKASGSITFTLQAEGDKLTIKLDMNVYQGRYWELTKMSEVRIAGLNNYNLKIHHPEEITAGTQFSYSCQSLKIKSPKVTNNTMAELSLTFKRFHLQPYGRFMQNKREKVFRESFDCATWFTVPLWTGTLVVLLFTAILAMGVIALLDIKTMDRFENPKGKTITIAATAD